MALLKVKVKNGTLLGLPAGNQAISVFKGIPFAAPPLGELRWRAPQPAEDWVGERQAYTYSEIPMQWRVSEASIYRKEFYPVELPRSEDCLYLNIWTPALTAGEKLPVALWIYGGGFYQGYANKMETDGEAFAKRGVIYVSFNYRLNIFGFLAHPMLTEESLKETGISTSGNYGILDQTAALDWVRTNIAAFGGDPDNITVFGQSAGAMSVQTLVSSTLTEGAIHKAIFQSAAGVGPFQKSACLSLERAESRGLDFFNFIGASSVDEIRGLSAETLLDYWEQYIRVKKDAMLFVPVVDGYVLEEDWISLALKGKFHDIPYMVGCTADEGLVGLPPKDAALEEIHLKAEEEYGPHAGRYLELAGAETMEAHIETLKKKRDILISASGWSALQNMLRRRPAYQYFFNHEIPASDIGTFHSSEHMYVFQTFLRGWRPYNGVDFELSNRMCGYWTNFIKNGHPNGVGLPEWTPYTAESPLIMALKTDGGMMIPPETELEKFEKNFILGNL